MERVIADTDHGGMRAATIHLPEKWHFESKIEWHYNWVEYPLSYSSHAENPDNAEAYFQYPSLRLESTEVPPQLRQYVKGPKLAPGERLPTGANFLPPVNLRCRLWQCSSRRLAPMSPISNGLGNRTCLTWRRP